MYSRARPTEWAGSAAVRHCRSLTDLQLGAAFFFPGRFVPAQRRACYWKFPAQPLPIASQTLRVYEVAGVVCCSVYGSTQQASSHNAARILALDSRPLRMRFLRGGCSANGRALHESTTLEIPARRRMVSTTARRCRAELAS